MTSWQAHTQTAYALFAQDIEDLLLAGEGITKEQPHRTKRRFLPRTRKVRITVVLAAAITMPMYDPHRTEKMRFNSATTARIEKR